MPYPTMRDGFGFVQQAEVSIATLPRERAHLVDMELIVRRQNREHCASIICMIRHFAARRAKVIEDHPHNAAIGSPMHLRSRAHASDAASIASRSRTA
jgi:hypothetical protein